MAKDHALVFDNNCCCLLDWCVQKRINHILIGNVVQFVAKNDSDRTEYDSWKRSLGLLHMKDFERTTRPRVRVGHFHPDNMIGKEEAATGNLLFDKFRQLKSASYFVRLNWWKPMQSITNHTTYYCWCWWYGDTLAALQLSPAIYTAITFRTVGALQRQRGRAATRGPGISRGGRSRGRLHRE